MLIFRPMTMHDLDDLYALAMESAFGLTTLTRDRDALARKISHAEHSFHLKAERPGGETYLFALEDSSRRRVIGTAAVESKVGGFQPFYSFRLEEMIRRSETLSAVRELRLLHLHTEHDGPTAIGTLYLMPEYRRDGNGRFLSLARFIFMAMFPQAFEKKVIAEMRGISDESGRSPFWEAVGSHFFGIDFPRADYLSSIDKKFIAELMPHYPVYANLLPESARNALGKTHPSTEPALKILYNEGFSFMHHIDIFDGGPLVHASLPEIRTIKRSRRCRLEGILDPAEGDSILMVATQEPFRVTRSAARSQGDGLLLEKSAVRLLGLEAGQEFQACELK
ncbi:MAG: arginine N-succinyltransferase [Spirochaetales bacterium]|nr:arginine N-succinyltransferase [Spirochaetales bacterium]